MVIVPSTAMWIYVLVTCCVMCLVLELQTEGEQGIVSFTEKAGHYLWIFHEFFIVKKMDWEANSYTILPT